MTNHPTVLDPETMTAITQEEPDMTALGIFDLDPCAHIPCPPATALSFVSDPKNISTRTCIITLATKTEVPVVAVRTK